MRIGNQVATGVAIQNPFTFYYVQNNDWSSSHSYQFWNKNFTNDPGVTNATTKKTIYSPSPTGFVEPKTAAFNYFSLTSDYTDNLSNFNVIGSFSSGWNFRANTIGGAIFFNALGMRSTEHANRDGELISSNEQCYYWTCGTSDSSLGRCLGFSYFHISPIGKNTRSNGFICRSVKY